MSEFLRCLNGHVYDSELKECPYCGGKELGEDLDKLPEKPEEEQTSFPPPLPLCYAPRPAEPRKRR